MYKNICIALAVCAVAVPSYSEAVVKSINGLTAFDQLLVSPPSANANTMHMEIVQVGADTHRFRWDGTPWRVDQGGTGTTTFQNGGLVFYDGSTLTQRVSPEKSLVWDDAVGKLTIGITTDGIASDALAKLLIVSTSTNQDAKGIFMRNYDASFPRGSIISLGGAGGTVDAPTAMVEASSLGTLSFNGYNGSAFTGGRARIRGVASGNWSASESGAGLQFDTTAKGTNTRTSVMSLTSEGRLGVGPGNAMVTTDPRSRIHAVTQDAGDPPTDGGQAGLGVYTGSALRLSSTNEGALDIGFQEDNDVWLQTYDNANFGINYNMLLNPNGGNVGIGTLDPLFPLTVTAGSNATTTVQFGAFGDTSSHACFNTKNTDGDDISFYFAGTTMVVESNPCPAQ